MDTHKLKVIAIIVLAAIGALYLGIAAATAQVEAIAWVVGGTILVVCLGLGRRIWLLLPLMSSFSLILPLPGAFTTAFLTQILVIGFCSLLFLMRRLPFEIKFTGLEFICLLLLLAVIQVYLRNPVGLNIFGGQMVGGKSYFIFAVSFFTAAILSTLRIDPNDLKWWVRLSVIGSLGNFALGVTARISPRFGYFLAASFSTDFIDESELAEGAATRVAFVRGIANTLAIWISSRISPLRGCFHPLYAPLILITLSFAAYSGFRSQLIAVGAYFLVGIAYRGGIISILVSFLIAAFALTSLALVNSVMPLPSNIQRSLTFLPGTWDQQLMTDAEGSTEWRVEMWKEALFTDRWIENKLLGDGLGFTKAELEATLAIKEGNVGERSITGLSSGQVNMMISGGYHSGPVQTIRTIGYVGLAILMTGFINMMIRAHRQVRRSRGTEWFVTVLFICIPYIAGPFLWTLVIGSFEGGAALLAMGTAMIRLLERNLPLPAYVTSSRHHNLPKPLQSLQSAQSQS